ncbi:MAG: hypothetical protein AAF969_12690 [Bacteroidota bacterium]
MDIEQKLAYFTSYQDIIPGLSVQYLKADKDCDGQFNFFLGSNRESGRSKATSFIVTKTYVEKNTPGHIMDLVFKHIGLKIDEAPDVVIIDWDSPIELNKPEEAPNFTRFSYLLWILPKSTRPEFISDVSDLRTELKSRGRYKIEIVLAILLMFISVGYHLFIGKLNGYFYVGKTKVK